MRYLMACGDDRRWRASAARNSARRSAARFAVARLTPASRARLATVTWAGYTVAMRRARLDGLHAAAISAVASLVLYLPAYVILARTSLLMGPPLDVALQAIVQGVLTAIVALLLYGRMVAILGATGGAAFVALTPAITALAAIPILNEWPSTTDWIAITLISVGVYLVSGGPVPARRP